MPPRFVYWTIIAGGLPMAFRATEREDLLPTFHRIKEKHPDAEMKWFARGKLWDSKEAAEREREERRARSAERLRAPTRPRTVPGRGRDWRPGGEHRDPRQKYKDAKKARNLDRRQEKFARKHGDGPPKRDLTNRPPPPPAPTGPARPPGQHRPDKQRPDFRGRPSVQKPPGQKPREDWRDRPTREKPRYDSARPRGPAKPFNRTTSRPTDSRPLPPKPPGPGARPRTSRPGGPANARPGG